MPDTSIDIGIEFRECTKTHKIHAFDRVEGILAEKAICGFKPTSGLTFPLELYDVCRTKRMCKACLKRKSN